MNQAVLATDHQCIWGAGDELSVRSFNLNSETFAIEATVVREILDHLPETHVPGAKSFVSIVTNFRGKVIPLADIRLASGVEVSEAPILSRLIVIELDLDSEPTLIGIRTDRVYKVTTLARTASEPPPSVGMRWWADYIDCLVMRGGEFVIIPNLNAIFVSQGDRSAVANG